MVPAGLHAPRLTLNESASTRDRPAGGIDLLQLAAGEERDGAAVGRPEREGGALGIGERRDGAVERSHPQRAPAFGTRGESEPLPVGRHHWPIGPVEAQAPRAA